MGRRKNYPWDSRVNKQMTNLISRILAGLIAAPLSGGGGVLDDISKMSLKEETIWVVIIALYASYFLIKMLFKPLVTESVIVLCITIGLLILVWLLVFFQVRRYKRSKNKEDK